MDIMSVLGWLFGILVILFGIVFDKDKGMVIPNLINFWDASSMAVVLGGLVAGLMVSFPVKCFARLPKHLKIVLFPTKYNPLEYIAQIVDLAKEARVNGLLSLEGYNPNILSFFNC